jgi:hypothetical protein
MHKLMPILTMIVIVVVAVIVAQKLVMPLIWK